MSAGARSLAVLDAALARLRRTNASDWTPLDATEIGPSSANLLAQQGFGRFCQIGRSKQANSSWSSSIDVGDATSDAREQERPQELSAFTVQSVQIGQTSRLHREKQGEDFGRSACEPVQISSTAVQNASQQRRDTLNRWLSAHPPPPCPPDRCAHCDGPIDVHATDALAMLRSVEPAEPIWLHLRCYPSWHHRRLDEAKAAVAAGWRAP